MDLLRHSWDQSFRILWDRFLVPIDDPGSRLFHLNILATLLLMIAWYFLNEKSGSTQIWGNLKRDIFNKKYWWNRSTKTDYKVYLLNALLKVFLFIPFLDISYWIASRSARTLVDWNSGEFLQVSTTVWALGGFTIFAFVFDDFARFLMHWLTHKLPKLWFIHKLHHSARVLTPFTLFRTHPIESAISTFRNALTMGLSAGVFIFVFEAPMSVFTLLGINIFGFAFNLLGSNLRHSQIPLEFGVFERVFISPRMHQIHHSRTKEHWDKNMGVSLSIWDQLFGTCVFSKQVPRGPLRYGL